MRNAVKAGLTISLMSFGVADAQDSDPAHLSLVAGYKAAFTCSATFNAGRTVEQIVGDELTRIYSGYRDALEALPDAEIDEEAKTVSVAYSENMPPRVAAWRPHLGCAQLPTGADPSMAVDLPRAKLRSVKLDANPDRPWPEGDALAKTYFTDTSEGAALSVTVDSAFDRMTYGEGSETTAVLVVSKGEIIAEKYRDGFDMTTPQRTWSVAKSIAASIIGAAVNDGLIDVKEPAGLAAWSAEGDPRGEITLEDLLHMSSGLTSAAAGNRTDDVYFGGGRVVDHAIDHRLVAEPGTRWRYANNDTMTAMRVLREKMGKDARYLAYPFKEVLHPIGMRHTFLETDWNGDFILSSQVWTTSRDLARLGLLYLNNGVWNGKRILPKNWAAYVASPSPDQPTDRRDGENRAGYGAQWWLFGERHGLPEGTYAAMGNRGQYLVIIPSRDMLVVRRGFDGRPGEGFNIAKFAADALAATPE